MMKHFSLPGHADSLLPENKNWRLVWNDEFDSRELDRSKWGFRRNFWGKPFPAFCGDEGVELDGNGTLKLNLIRKGDDFFSSHLQTGSLTYDIPRDTDGIWPFGKYEEAKFMHRYGYFEIRCRLPRNPGWHAAFWLQSPSIGAHPDPRRAGIECDIMESYRQHTKGDLICGTIWGGYGKNGVTPGHFSFPYVETEDGWHYYGVDWSPDGYVFYADGQEIGRQNEQVSEVEQFILVSTECHGYRGRGFDAPGVTGPGKPTPLLFEAKLPDCFEVDFVRVFDECYSK